MEKSIIQFLENYKIQARNDKKNIGIWVKDKKIAAIGIRVSKWVAYHGCSINISNNLNQYLKIFILLLVISECYFEFSYKTHRCPC